MSVSRCPSLFNVLSVYFPISTGLYFLFEGVHGIPADLQEDHKVGRHEAQHLVAVNKKSIVMATVRILMTVKFLFS